MKYTIRDPIPYVSRKTQHVRTNREGDAWRRGEVRSAIQMYATVCRRVVHRSNPIQTIVIYRYQSFRTESSCRGGTVPFNSVPVQSSPVNRSPMVTIVCSSAYIVAVGRSRRSDVVSPHHNRIRTATDAVVVVSQLDGGTDRVYRSDRNCDRQPELEPQLGGPWTGEHRSGSAA